VLASHKRLDPASPRLAALLQEADPGVVALAWHVVAMLDEPGASILRPLRAAVQSADRQVRDAALRAAIWCGTSWAKEAVRKLAQSGDAVGLQWTAATCAEDALPLLRTLGALAGQAPAAFGLVARLGHPAMMSRCSRPWAAKTCRPHMRPARPSCA